MNAFEISKSLDGCCFSEGNFHNSLSARRLEAVFVCHLLVCVCVCVGGGGDSNGSPIKWHLNRNLSHTHTQQQQQQSTANHHQQFKLFDVVTFGPCVVSTSLT